MKLNRRQFFEKAAEVGGIFALASLFSFDTIAKMIGVKPSQLPDVLRDWDTEAAAATLPLNYVTRPFLVPSGADVRNGATILTTNVGGGGSGSSSAVDNTSTPDIKNGGTKNILVTLTSISGLRLHDMRCSLPALSMALVPTIGYRVCFPENGLSTDWDNQTFDWTNDTTINDGFRFRPRPVPDHSAQRRGWQFWTWHRDEYQLLLGAGNWQNTFARIRFLFSAPDNNTRMFIWDQNFYNGYQHPVLAWVLEGGLDSHYSVAFAKWTVKGVVGTLAIPTSVLDTNPGTNLTTSMVDEMYAQGWDVVQMSDTTTALTGLTKQQVIDRVGAARNVLKAKGWTRTLNDIILPGSNFTDHRADSNAIEALQQLGMQYAVDKWQDGSDAQQTNGWGADPSYGFTLNPYRVPAWRTENPDVLSEYQAHLRHIIKAGGVRILRSGGLATGAGAGQIETADHDALLLEATTYNQAGTISLVPWRKMVSGLGGRMVR